MKTNQQFLNELTQEETTILLDLVYWFTFRKPPRILQWFFRISQTDPDEFWAVVQKVKDFLDATRYPF